MNSHRQTKRALLTSVMALVMCVVMLLGTTFAWFTDTATANVNTIKSGNLDVMLEMEDSASTTGWKDAEGETLSFLQKQANGTVTQNANILWEPGCTYELPKLRVVNNGNLNLKYKIEITGIKGSAKLNDVIDWTMKLNGVAFAIGSEHVLNAATAGTGRADILTISGHMRETAGNTYMNEKIEGITITLKATQATGEYDSTTDQYDKNAQYPNVSYTQVSTQDELNNALKNPTDANGNFTKDVAIEMPVNSTFTLDNGIANEDSKSRNVTFIGDGSQTVDVVTKAVNAAEGNEMNYQRGSSFAFQNVTVRGGKTTYGGIVCNELTFENCTIKNKLTLYGKATFINCTFENDMADQYSIWTWGGTDVTFEGCTFNTNGKAILLFGEDKTTSLTVNNCKFYDRTDGTAGKAAIEIGDANYGKHNNFTVVINNSTVEQGFAINTNGTNTHSKLWANKNSMDAAHLTVTIDGVKVQ